MDNFTYADVFGIFSSLTDVKIDFASTQPRINEKGDFVDEKVSVQRIVLSLPLAKDLAKKLSDAVQDYENHFGDVLNLDEARKNLQQGKTDE